MSEFAAFMMAAPTTLSLPTAPKNNKPTSKKPPRRSFRHSRTSSGSQLSSPRPSQETPYTTSDGPAVVGLPAYFQEAQHHHHHHNHNQYIGTTRLSSASSDGQSTATTWTSQKSAGQQSEGRRSLSRPPLSRPPGERFIHRTRTAQGIPTVDSKDVAMPPDVDPSSKTGLSSKSSTLGFPRAESISSTSGTTSLSARTLVSTEPSASDPDNPLNSKPFVLRNGRTYLNDPTLAYPLPSDLTELHRQSLRTLLLIQVLGGPVCSPSLTINPPRKVLEIGCGSGFWSMMCHRYFKSRGHSNISFTGMDIAPLAPGSANIPTDSVRPDRDMNWSFIHHDIRHFPWPIKDEEYDFVMVKDMSWALTNPMHQDFVDEQLRILKPGGTLEIWESDHLVRMLRPHVPASTASGDTSDEQDAASGLGAYVMTANTPLSAPLNTYLVDYNNWLSRSLEARDISAVPCTIIGPSLLQEAEILTDVRSRRLAIPLSEVRWEREGVGGVVTKDGKSYVESKGKTPHQKVEKKTLSAGQAALRSTALLTVVQQIQALEPLLREVSGKSQDEWDTWQGKMMNELLSEGGTSWGECLEVGAWWARKR